MTNPTDSPATEAPHTRTAISASNLQFQWAADQPVLRFPDLVLAPGQHLFLRGPSGSGKSTLLSMLGGLIHPTAGELTLLDRDMGPMSGGQRDRFRADHMGVIFQQFNLVPYLSTLGNVLLPCRLSANRRQRATPSPNGEAEHLLSQLAIPQSHWHRSVAHLSVGQQQRVAAARALIGSPELVLADEPTSALDSDNRDRFIELLLELAAEHHSAVVFVSHDQSLASRFAQQLSLEATR